MGERNRIESDGGIIVGLAEGRGGVIHTTPRADAKGCELKVDDVVVYAGADKALEGVYAQVRVVSWGGRDDMMTVYARRPLCWIGNVLCSEWEYVEPAVAKEKFR